jgi:hypothetical protein
VSWSCNTLRCGFSAGAVAAPEKPRPAPSTTPVPAPGPTVVEVKHAPEDLWPRVLAVAAQTPSDEAKVRHLVFRELDGRTLRLGVNEGGATSARFLSSQGEWVAALVQRATGQRVKVEIASPSRGDREEPPPPPGSRIEAARQLPLVRQAMDVLGATVIDVQDAPRRDEEERP